MGSILFDFLAESALLDSECIEHQYSQLSDTAIAEELRRYREFCLTHSVDLLAEVVGSSPGFHVFPGTRWPSQSLLKQSALYVERYVLSDPLFALTEPERDFDKVMRSHFGDSEPSKPDRPSIAKAAARLKGMTPMVAYNYVKFLPVSYLFEAPENLPLYYSENRFADALPSDLLSFFHQHATVRPLRRDGNAFSEDPEARVSRFIAVEFGDDSRAGMMYQLFQQKIENFDKETGEFTASLKLPSGPPAQDYYNAWVEQSINRTAINFYDQLRTEIGLSAQLGASYMCFSEFRHDLLAKFFPTEPNNPGTHASILLQLNLPFLDEIDVDVLMRLRQDESDAFRVFRHDLERRFWDLRTENDPEKLRLKAEQIVHEIGTVQNEILTVELGRVRRGALAQTVIGAATLAGAFVPGAHYVAALVAAAAGCYKIKSDYEAALRQNPCFFLWKARRLSK